jgi:hypothetical protein
MASRKSKAERAPARQKRAEVRTVEPADEIEEVKAGMGIEDGIVLMTTILLLGAIVLGAFALQAYPA